MMNLGYAMCGSFCTLSRSLEMMAELSKSYEILPIFSEITYHTDTRFGTAAEMIANAERISGRPVLHDIVSVEPIGPKKLVDLLLVAPCTGNSLSKAANGITDSSVTMAMKSALRIGIPVVLCVASNDGLGGSGQNLIRLLNTKNVYLVPLKQDDPQKKPLSLVADFSQIPATIDAALRKEQRQPIFF